MMGESTIFNQSEVSQQTTQRILTVKIVTTVNLNIHLLLPSDQNHFGLLPS